MRISTKSIFKGSTVDGKTKIISAGLFRMKKSYNPFEKYLAFCLRFIEQVQRILPEWIARIYVDESVKDDELEKLHAPHVELVLYRCDEFWDSESETHEGVFGTFMRFLPMFSAQKYEAMVSSDIDVPDFWFETFKWFDTNAKEVGLVNQSCYSSWIPRGSRFNLLAGGIFTRVVFPRRLLTTFLKRVYEEKLSLKSVKPTDTATYMPYGSDEYFLNTVLYPYLEEHKIKVLALTMSTVFGEVWRILKQRPKGVHNDIDEKIEKHMTKLKYVERAFWMDPRSVGPKQFEKHIKEIIEVVEPEYQDLFYNQCMNEFFKSKKMLRQYKYNY